MAQGLETAANNAKEIAQQDGASNPNDALSIDSLCHKHRLNQTLHLDESCIIAGHAQIWNRTRGTGIPEVLVITDNGSCFVSENLKQFCPKTASSTSHPLSHKCAFKKEKLCICRTLVSYRNGCLLLSLDWSLSWRSSKIVI